jgi:hypothetical protein
MRFGPPGNNSASISVLYGPSLAAKQTLTQCRAGHDKPATLKLGCVSVSARRLPLRLFLLLLPHLLQTRGDAGGNGLGLVLAVQLASRTRLAASRRAGQPGAQAP